MKKAFFMEEDNSYSSMAHNEVVELCGLKSILFPLEYCVPQPIWIMYFVLCRFGGRLSCCHQVADRSGGRDLLDILDQAVVQPLDGHFGATAEGKAVHLLVGFDIPEDRFDDLHPVSVGVTPCRGVDELFHALGEGFGLCRVHDKEIAP